MTALFRTSNDKSLLYLRLVLAAIIFPHGAQKVLGWFGGYGYEGTMGFFTGQLGIPAVFAFLAIVAEFVGSIGVALGLLTRVAAFGILSVMATAAYLVHAGNGFFMNWSGQQAGEGFEYHLVVGALALLLTIRGAGAVSVDAAIAAKLDQPGAAAAPEYATR